MPGRALASVAVYFRQVLNHDTACASYLFGCKSRGRFAVVDPHVDLVTC
jgi:hydroxyacylglutathione hydrolase